MIKSFRKKTTPVDIFELPPALEGSIFSYGRLGSGKSVSLLSVVQGFHDNNNFKILDIFGGERNEGMFWTIPSQEESYWTKLGALGKFDEAGPKQYKVNLLYPYFGSKLPKKLPKKEPFIQSKVFTIPLLSLIPEDVSMVIGSASETSKYELNELLYNCDKKTNSGNIDTIIESKKNKMLKNTLFYKNFFLPLVRNRLLMDAYCDLNLDLVDEMKDRETISVLCLDFVPEQFHIFIMNYMLRNLVELVDKNKISKKNLIFMREAATFFRATDDSILEDKFKIFRTKLAHYLRMSRRGLVFALDCQSSSETKGLVSDAQDLLLAFRMSSFRDKEEIFGEAKREKRVRMDQLADLAFLEKGQCLILPQGKVCKKVQMVLPRTMFWKKEYGNFYHNVWERYGGEWHYTNEIHDYIEGKCKIKQLTKKLREEEAATVPPASDINSVTSEAQSVVYPPENLVLPNDIESQPVEKIEVVPSKRKKKEEELNDILDLI